jgi:hypothetical protein
MGWGWVSVAECVPMLKGLGFMPSTAKKKMKYIGLYKNDKI